MLEEMMVVLDKRDKYVAMITYDDYLDKLLGKVEYSCMECQSATIVLHTDYTATEIRKLLKGDIRVMNNEMYPLTIIRDRYNGTYSGGMYLAFNLEYDEIPQAVSGSDMDCANFWRCTKLIVGKGANIHQAYDDLKEKIKEVLEDA